MENNVNPLLTAVLGDTLTPPYLNPSLPSISERHGTGIIPEKYLLMVPEKGLDLPGVRAIVDSKKKVKDMTQEELRVIYHFIGGTPLKRVYSASIINHIARTGKWPNYDDLPEGDSLFIGNMVHEAMETKGENLKNIAIYKEIGDAPEKPALDDLTADNIKILAKVAVDVNYVQAYCDTKDNKTIDAVDPDEIALWETDTEHVPSKDLAKLIAAAKKEYDKVSHHIAVYRAYVEKFNTYQQKKDKLKASGKTILDDIPYRAMGAERMMTIIQETFKALKDSQEVMNQYWYGYATKQEGIKMESLTEFVILWDYEIRPGKTIACKSMLDKLHLDFTNKTAIVQDIKTHSKPSYQFVSKNYFDFGYYRSMAFYKAAIEAYLTQRGEDASKWKIFAILLPVSTVTFEVGCFNPTVIISPVDLDMGTDGGYMKPIGTKFNISGQAQWGLDLAAFTKLAELGILHRNAYEYYVKGWKQVVKEIEATSYVPGALGGAVE